MPAKPAWAPLRDVLVATDFSEAGTRAVERAARLPLAPDSTLTLLHVLPAGPDAADRARVERALAEAASRAAAALADAGRTGVTVATLAAQGMPYAEIVRTARAGKHGLVVVGRHGERRLRELLLGSTAERVVHSCEIPVLVVAEHPAGPYRRPLVAVDCSDGSQRALELARRVAGAAARLEVVHAYEPAPDSALRRAAIIGEAARREHVEAKRRAELAVEAFLEGHGSGPADVVVREGVPRRAILDVAAQHDSDLVAVGTHGRTGLAHLRLGSVSEGVLRGATCDVLVAATGRAAPDPA